MARRVLPSAQPLIDPERDRFVPGIPDSEPAAPMDENALGALESAEIVSQPDGSAILLELTVTASSKGAFDENLAERMDESDLQAISTDLLEKIRRDKEARSKRDGQNKRIE